MSFHVATPGGFGSAADWFPSPWEQPGGVSLEPMAAAGMDWMGAASSVLGAALAPSPSPAYSDAGGYASFDNSGFAVDFGPGGISQTQPMSLWVLAGLGLLVLVWLKKQRK